MPRYEDDERFVDAIDENGLVKDGKGLRVSFMDAMRARQPEASQTWDSSSARPFVTDTRPGGPYVIDRRAAPTAADMADARRALAAAYAAYDTADANRWRAPPNGPVHDAGEFKAGNRIPVGAYPRGPGYQEGDECTINGQSGRLVRQGDYLVCRPRASNDARHVHKITQRDPMGREAASYEYSYEQHEPDDDHEHDQSTDSVADAQQRLQDARAQAYAAYDAEQSEAWRNPR
jgi:hypothetical protein